MKILNFGSLNIDMVYQVDHIVLPGETLSGGDVKLFAGGKGANQSVALSKAGAEVYHAGKIGEDGKWLLEKLGSFGVRTDFVWVDSGATGHAIIQVTPEGQNSIILSGGGNHRIGHKEIDETLASFEKGDWLVLQNEINGIDPIIRAAREKGMKICMNPAPFDKSVFLLPLELIDLLIVNELEAAGLARMEGTYGELLDKLTGDFPGQEIVMTAGEDGAFYGKDSQRIKVPASKVTAVDTTAAGDTYLGYFLASRITGLDIKESMERASSASAMTVSRAGAMDSIPYAEELPD